VDEASDGEGGDVLVSVLDVVASGGGDAETSVVEESPVLVLEAVPMSVPDAVEDESADGAATSELDAVDDESDGGGVTSACGEPVESVLETAPPEPVEEELSDGGVGPDAGGGGAAGAGGALIIEKKVFASFIASATQLNVTSAGAGLLRRTVNPCSDLCTII